MSNMYDFVQKTWNPVGGECPHKCTYCYVERNKKRFPAHREKYSGEQRLIESEMKRKFKPGETVFVGSCNDLFASRHNYFCGDVIIKTGKFDETTFIFQTKNPELMNGWAYYSNNILCVTIESNRVYPEMGNSPIPEKRIIDTSNHKRRWVTIEPIMDFDLEEFVQLIKANKPEQVNIGADTGHNNLTEPPKEKILALIAELLTFTKVVTKYNLNRLLK